MHHLLDHSIGCIRINQKQYIAQLVRERDYLTVSVNHASRENVSVRVTNDFYYTMCSKNDFSQTCVGCGQQ